MATRYWVGGTGNWNTSDTTHWSDSSGGSGGFSVPTSADDVYFDLHSNEPTDAAYTVTIAATANCKNLDVSFTGTTKVTLAGTSAIDIYGNLNFSGGTSQITRTYTGTITFKATSGTKTINTNGVTLENQITFNGTGGTFQLLSDITIQGVKGISRINGTFDPNGYTVTLSGYNQTISGPITFYNLTKTATASNYQVLSIAGGTITVTNLLTITGTASPYRILVESSLSGTQRTITSASNSISYADFRDIVGAGAASWDLSAITGLSGDCGGNSGITFTTGTDQHYLTSGNTTWSTVGNWTSRVPLPQDNAIFDHTFGATDSIILDTKILGKNVDFSSAVFATSLNLVWNNQVELTGSLTLKTGMVSSGTGELWFRGRSANTLDSQGFSWNRAIRMYCPSGSVTLKSNLTATSGGFGKFYNVYGTFYTIDGVTDYVLTTCEFSQSSGGTTIFGGGTHLFIKNNNFTGGGTFQSGTYTLKFTDTSNNSLTFTGGNLTYNNVWFDRGSSTGTINIYGSNTFSDFKDSGTAAHDLMFEVGKTQTLKTFSVNGTLGNKIRIASTSFSASAHYLVKSTPGNIICSYLDIYYSSASPIGNWYADATCTDHLGASGGGWIFGSPDFTNPTYVYADDSNYATALSTDGDVSVLLSGDAGLSYTAPLTETFTSTESTQTYGLGATELWGSTWLGSNITDTNFRVLLKIGNTYYSHNVYKTFGFSITSTLTLTGIEVAVKAKWNGSTISINHLKVKIYYGTSVLPIQAGSMVYASNGRKAGEGAGAGTGVLVFNDGTNWKAVDTGLTVAA